MRQFMKPTLLWASLVIIVLLCFGIWYVKTDHSAQIELYSGTPEWDLRGVDMQSHYVRLRGGISDYVPGEFLTPEAFAASDAIQTGSPKDAAEAYTARIRLLVEDDRPYAIAFASVDYADSIYINGQYMQSVGVPGESAATAVPRTRYVYYTVMP